MNCLNNETNVKIKFVRIGIEQSDRHTIITSRTSLKWKFKKGVILLLKYYIKYNINAMENINENPPIINPNVLE